MGPIIKPEIQPMCEHVKGLTSQSQQHAENMATHTQQIDALNQQLADSRKELESFREEMKGNFAAVQNELSQANAPKPKTANSKQMTSFGTKESKETEMEWTKTPPNAATGEQRFAGLWMKEIQAARRDLDEWSLGEQLRIDDEEFEEFCKACDDTIAKEYAILTQEQRQSGTTFRPGGVDGGGD